MKVKQSIKRPLFIFLIIDVLIVILHILIGSKQMFFNLDWEQNLPTMYQSYKLILAGSILLTVAILLKKMYPKIKSKLLVFQYGLAFGIITMGFDECAELHESLPRWFRELVPSFASWYEGIFSRLGFQSSIWIVYVLIFVPLVLFWILYTYKEVIKFHGKKITLLLLGLFVFFGGAVFLEFLGTTDYIYYSQWSEFNWYEIVMIAEEFLEMVGATIIFYYGYRELNLLLKKS